MRRLTGHKTQANTYATSWSIVGRFRRSVAPPCTPVYDAPAATSTKFQPGRLPHRRYLGGAARDLPRAGPGGQGRVWPLPRRPHPRHGLGGGRADGAGAGLGRLAWAAYATRGAAWALGQLALVLLVWLATFFIAVPFHNRLAADGYNYVALDGLTRTNWLRTLAWTARAALLGWPLGQLIGLLPAGSS